MEKSLNNTRAKIRHCCCRLAGPPPPLSDTHAGFDGSEGGCEKRVGQVEALQVQMEEQTRHTKEQLETLLEDRRIKAEEAETQRIRDQEQIRALTDRWVAFQKK